jgi:hypothetical protein
MFGAIRGGRERRRRIYEDIETDSSLDISARDILKLISVVLLLVSLSLYNCFDLPSQRLSMRYVEKRYIPAHRGITSTGASYLVDDRWEMSFYIGYQPARVEVSHEFYDQIKEGDILNVFYTKSRILGNIDIISVGR